MASEVGGTLVLPCPGGEVLIPNLQGLTPSLSGPEKIGGFYSNSPGIYPVQFSEEVLESSAPF